MSGIQILGTGLWTPGFASVEAWMGGTADPAVTRPEAGLLPPNLRRRTSLLTRALADVAAQATGTAELNQVHTVFASAFGETATSVTLLGMMHDADGSLSPLRFAGSVHNTASGNVSIATGNRGVTTSLAAGLDTVAMALLEAWGLLQDRGGEVLVAVGDMTPPEALVDASRRFPLLAVGLRLGRETHAYPALSPPRRTHTSVAMPTETRAIESNPMSPALRLVEAIERRSNGTIQLGPRWGVDLDCGGVG